MKTLRLILLAAVVSQLAVVSTVSAQIYSPRRLTRRIAPQTATNSAAQHAPAPAPTLPSATPAPTAPPPAPAQVIVKPPIDPEVAKSARDQAARKAFEYQKKRAEEGSESAQYEVGMHYLKGDTVDKDEATARKWLALSSKNGYSAATKRLEELEKTGTETTPAPASAAESVKVAK